MAPRKKLSGIVSQLSSTNTKTQLHVLGAKNQIHQLEYHAQLSNELRGQPIKYHERNLHNNTYQIIEPALAEIDDSLAPRYITKKPVPNKISQAVRAKAAHYGINAFNE